MISAILFDLDNTLIDRDQAFRRMIRSRLSITDAMEKRLVELDESGYGDRSQLFNAWTEIGGEPINSKKFGLAISEFVPRQADLLEALEKLSHEFELAIVTNGSVTVQTAKWKSAGLDSIIPRERLWVSEAVGIEKPLTGIFLKACQTMQLEPDACLYVGDQPEIDIRGANEAGLYTHLVGSPLTAGAVAGLAKTAKTFGRAA